MTSRGLVALAVAAVLAVAVALWLADRRDHEAPPAGGGTVLAGARAKVNDITEVRISKGPLTRTTLKRGKDGWTVAERSYPADAGKVRKLLIDLTGLKVVEEKTSDPASYAKLGVEDVKDASSGGTLVELVAPPATLGLIVGKSAGTHASYVRVVGQPKSLMATPDLTVEAEPKHWLTTELVDVDAERTQKIEMTPESGPAWTAERATRDAALAIAKLPKGREVSSGMTVSALAGMLDGLQFEDVAAPPAPEGTAKSAEKPERLVLTTFDGLVVELTGRRSDKQTFVQFAAQFDPEIARHFAPAGKDAKPKPAADVQKEADTLAARGKGREFEIQSWKYDAMFQPLEKLLKPLDKPLLKKKG